MGHTVFIFAPQCKGYKDENNNVFRYPSLDIRYKIKFPIPIPFSSEIDEKIKKMDFDIIHSQHPNLLGDAAAKWAKKKNIPLVFTWHTLYDKYTHYTPFIPKAVSSYWIIKNASKYANKADKVIIPTGSIKNIIKDWGVKNKDIIDIPTGVESYYFINPDGKKIRDKLGISVDKKIIMSISRFTEEKNVLFLLKSVIKALKKYSNSVFVFAGEGYLREEMEKIIGKENIGKRIIFPGIVKKEEIKDYMAAADIFTYASESETQGTIITEAMYSRLPIVALDATGSKSLVENNRTGILVSDDEEEFSKAILKLAENEDLAEYLRESAKKTADEKYTSEVCARRMIEAYRETIERYKK